MAPDKLCSGLKSILFGHSFRYLELFYQRVVRCEHICQGLHGISTLKIEIFRLFDKIQTKFGLIFQEWSNFGPLPIIWT